MYIDKVKIYIKAGNGGDGHVSFRREKYVIAGGPDGGDGGNGGSVIFVARESLRTLLDFRYTKHFRAVNGENGGKKNSSGKCAEDLIVEVPVGTLLKDFETGKVIADMNKPDVEKVILKGGHGGKGNARFATPTRQAPAFAKPGVKTNEHGIILELKSIADVGLVGFPNVGKSTLLSVITAAKPKIANYHFTTLQPNLGILSVHGNSYAIADIPGLIEGANEGVGLGHDFLRHIERTRMLIHVIDVSGMEGRDPIEDYKAILNELTSYNEELASRPTIVAANKMDMPNSSENFEKLKAELEKENIKVFPISAITRTGLEELLNTVDAMLKEIPVPTGFLEEEVLVDVVDRTFTIRRANNIFYVEGGLVKDIFSRIFPDDPDSMRYFQKVLIKTGIIEELRKAGAEHGDTIDMDSTQFEFID